MGFTRSVRGLRSAVFATLGDPALLNGTVQTRARVKVRDEALSFGQGSALASAITIELPAGVAVARGDTLTVEGRTYRVTGDPMEVRSGVHMVAAQETTP